MALVRQSKATEPRVCLFVGWDMSPTHACVVARAGGGIGQGGQVVYQSALVGLARDAKTYSWATRLEPMKMADPDSRYVLRLGDVDDWVERTMVELADFCQDPLGYVIIGLEGYAYRASNHAHAKGEAGGLVRLRFQRVFADRLPRRSQGLLRVHGPDVVKKACGVKATGKRGKSKKESDKEKKAKIIAAARELGFDPPSPDSDLGGDWADGCVLSELVLQEWLVRRGLLELRDLRDTYREVFNTRPTDAHPVNLLARPYITPEGEWP